MINYKILDEIIIIDGGSMDSTVSICSGYDEYVKVYNQADVMTEYDHKGKGEALWKGLYKSTSDIVIYIDSDIKNFDVCFVTGIIAPLLISDDIKYVKGFYKRPLVLDNCNNKDNDDGGRVTELCARPLLNMLYPDLAGFIQPLGGEYGGFRSVLESIHYTTGYSIEVYQLIQIYEMYGLKSMAQVNLNKRIHRHQSLNSLSKMSFTIMHMILSYNNTCNNTLYNNLLIKNYIKQNDNCTKSRSETHIHCNSHGECFDNTFFKNVTLSEVMLPPIKQLMC